MVFDRLIKRLKSKKSNYEFELEADNGEYEVKIVYWVNRNFFLQAAHQAHKTLKKDFKVAESFEVPDRLLGSFGKKVTGALDQIKTQVREDKPDFEFLSSNIDSGFYKRDGDKYFLTLTVSGICKGD